MTAETTQYIFKLLAWVVAIIVVGIFAALIASIFVFGDGEAQAIIGDLTPIALGILGSLVVMFTGHQITVAAQTHMVANVQIQQQKQALAPTLTPTLTHLGPAGE